ncbi:MAG TPA: STAS domain-containing protein [Nocardioidaceae bacterium]|jgi:anti-sigma B factor antagonist|nr:STAS domain-containing protein [Nocardioidaceae bacterium]
MELEIEVIRQDGHAVVVPRGDVDLATNGRLREAIDELVVGGEVHLVVDLDEVSFLDSTGLGALIGARRKTHAFKGSFALVCTKDQVMKLFTITGLDKVFAIHADRESAIPAAAG